MRVLVPYPVEAPARSLDEPARGARRELIVVGERTTPTSDGWTREERAVEAGREYFLGQLLTLDASDGSSVDAVVNQLITGRLKALVLHVGGVVVPTWTKLDDLTQDLLLTANRLWPVPADGGVALVEPPTPMVEQPLYRLDGTTSARLAEVKRVSGKYGRAGLVERVTACSPSWEELNAETLTAMVTPNNVRDFEAATAVARRFRSGGRSGVWIARYLSTFGFENSRGVPGAWHHARLTEVLGDGAR